MQRRHSPEAECHKHLKVTAGASRTACRVDKTVHCGLQSINY